MFVYDLKRFHLTYAHTPLSQNNNLILIFFVLQVLPYKIVQRCKTTFLHDLSLLLQNTKQMSHLVTPVL